MSGYRLYTMTPVGNHIEAYEPIDARDDMEAIVLSAPRCADAKLELWMQGRQVWKFDPKDTC